MRESKWSKWSNNKSNNNTLGLKNKNAKHNQIMLARQTRKTNENKPKKNKT